MLVLQEQLVFFDTLLSNVLECKDMSHSRKGCHQGFQNVLESRVLEPICLKAFRNGKKMSFSERF